MLRCLLLAAALAATGPCLGRQLEWENLVTQIEEMHGDAAGFEELADGLSQAVLDGSPEDFADLLAYPVEVAANGEVYDVPDAELFVRDFDTLVQEDLRTALVSFKFEHAVVTSEGVGILAGRIWFANQCLDDDCTETSWIVTRIDN